VCTPDAGVVASQVGREAVSGSCGVETGGGNTLTTGLVQMPCRLNALHST